MNDGADAPLTTIIPRTRARQYHQGPYHRPMTHAAATAFPESKSVMNTVG